MRGMGAPACRVVSSVLEAARRAPTVVVTSHALMWSETAKTPTTPHTTNHKPHTTNTTHHHTPYTPHTPHTPHTPYTPHTQPHTPHTPQRVQPGCTHSGDLSVPLAVDMSLHVDGACGAAMRRQRRLRAQWRHEQQTVAMVLATVGHHSFGPTAYDALRSQKPRHQHQRGSGGRDVRRATATSLPPPGTRPASLAEPRGDVMQVQRHTVEHLADGAPSLPTLDVLVPQMVDQLVDILKIIAKLSPAVYEQVIDVPRSSRTPPQQRLKPPEPQQLVEVPVPPVREVMIMAPFVDTAGRTWYWISTPDGRYTWLLDGARHTQQRRPEGITTSPGRYINTGQRMRISTASVYLAVICSVLDASWSDSGYMILPVYGCFFLSDPLVDSRPALICRPYTAHCLVRPWIQFCVSLRRISRFLREKGGLRILRSIS